MVNFITPMSVSRLDVRKNKRTTLSLLDYKTGIKLPLNCFAIYNSLDFLNVQTKLLLPLEILATVTSLSI